MFSAFARKDAGVSRAGVRLLSQSSDALLGGGADCKVDCDTSDDIAYSTYDLEDNFKAGFLTPTGLFALDQDIYESVAQTIRTRLARQYPDSKDTYEVDADFVKIILFHVFEDMLFGDDEGVVPEIKMDTMERMFISAEVQAFSRSLATDGYQRTRFTSKLVQMFLEEIEVIRNENYPQLHNVRLKLDAFLYVEVLKNITYHAIIRSPFLQLVEYRGKDIVKDIFNALKNEDGTRLLPSDFQILCSKANEIQRMRTICDFIAGMTDRYAFEFYDRLFGSSRLTIHKPIG